MRPSCSRRNNGLKRQYRPATEVLAEVGVRRVPYRRARDGAPFTRSPGSVSCYSRRLNVAATETGKMAE